MEFEKVIINISRFKQFIFFIKVCYYIYNMFKNINIFLTCHIDISSIVHCKKYYYYYNSGVVFIFIILYITNKNSLYRLLFYLGQAFKYHINVIAIV